MKEINTEIIINAPIEKVWATLIDFSSYPIWNPFIRKIEGELQANKQLNVTIQPGDKKPMTFRPHVISFSEYKFSWIGNLWLPGLFDGQHNFLLIKITEDQTKFIHSENFSGILNVPIFCLIGKSNKEGFDSMNKALKKRCESL